MNQEAHSFTHFACDNERMKDVHCKHHKKMHLFGAGISLFCTHKLLLQACLDSLHPARLPLTFFCLHTRHKNKLVQYSQPCSNDNTTQHDTAKRNCEHRLALMTSVCGVLCCIVLIQAYYHPVRDLELVCEVPVLHCWSGSGKCYAPSIPQNPCRTALVPKCQPASYVTRLSRLAVSIHCARLCKRDDVSLAWACRVTVSAWAALRSFLRLAVLTFSAATSDSAVCSI